MKTPTYALCLGALIASCTFNSEARVVTLFIGGTRTNDAISISTNEVAKVVTLVDSAGAATGSGVRVTKEANSFMLNGRSVFSTGESAFFGTGATFAGPATVELVASGHSAEDSVAVTIEIIPESFPPDKTIIVPAGTGATIALESSTDLIHWTDATPGTYTNREQNLFFRIRAERIP